MAYARLRTANTSGLHPNLRGLRGLGANPTLTAEAAMQAAIQAYGAYHLNSRDFQDSAWLQEAESQIAAGQFNIGWYSTACSTAPSNVNLFQTASGLALGTTSATVGILASTAVISTATAALAGALTMGIGALVAVIGLIFAHHAAAVKRDTAFGCGALPAVNNSFQLVAQAVQAGQLSASDAASGIVTIYEQFMSAGGASGSASGPGSVPSGGTAINDSPYCNSNCEMSVILFGMVLYWQSQYQALAAQQSAEAQQAAAVSTPSGVSTQTPATVVPSTTPTPSTSPSSVSSSMVVPAAIVAPAASGVSAVPAWAWLLLAAVGAWAVA